MKGMTVNHCPSIFRLAVLAAFVLVAPIHPGVAASDEDIPCSVVDPRVTCVMTGLDNPRGLAFAPNGALFVAEAGRGGAPCPGTMGLNCYGLTGAVSRYWKGRQDRVATGLPSISFPLGAQARGPHDISMHGLGNARVTIGLEADPATRETRGRPGLGWLVDVPASTLMAPSIQSRTDEWSFDVDVAAFETANNPDGRPVLESDPYGLLALPGHYVVVDAGANALLDVDKHGEISLLGVFPSRPGRSTDSVPTSVAVGPDGAYYVSEFTGFGAPLPAPGDARIYRVVPGEGVQVFCTGFNRIIDIAFDGDGSLYVLEIYTGPMPTGPGALFRVVLPPPDSPDHSCPDRQLVDTGVVLDGPTAIAIGPDGALYISNHGTRVGVGEVLRIER